MAGQFTIKIKADSSSSFTVMFEPSGMPYELGPSEVMYARIEDFQAREMEIVYWEGGISVWPPGPVITLDSEGNELNQL